MDNKKIIMPKLSFSDVDEGWKSMKLGRISTVVRGGSPRPIAEYLTNMENGLNWLKIGDIAESAKYIEHTSEKIKREGKNMTRQIYPGDFILSNSMSFGRPYISKINTCIHDGWIAITEIDTKIDSDYLYYFISSDLAQTYFKQMAAGSGVKNLNAEIIQNLIIHYPLSIIHSNKIASCLSSLDEVISAHSQKLDLLKDHKKGLMQNLFPQDGDASTSSARVPKFRFKEFEKDGEWVEKKLGEIAENLDSKRVPITSTQREKGNIPYYGASGIVDYVKDYIFNETLLCVSEDGANLIDRNYPIAFTIIGKTWVNNHAHVLKFENLNTHILVEKYINSISIEDFLTGMAQPKLNRGNLDVIPIPIPQNPEEQKKIASVLSSLDELITAQVEKIEQLKEHKKGLMQGLFPSSVTN